MSKGKLCLFASAVIYGVAPAFSAAAYRGGANGVTLTFLRAVLAIPALMYILRRSKCSFALDRGEVRKIIILGVFGGAAPILLLQISYSLIPTGLATVLHFVYPLIIVVASAFIYRERVSLARAAAVTLTTVGVFMFVNLRARSDRAGILLALLSGIFYSFYVIYLSRSGLDGMDNMKLTFYVSVIMGISAFAFGFLTDQLDFNFRPSAWLYAVCISLMINLGALPLFQLGVRTEGAETAGIMSTLEPITSIAAGALLFHEFFGAVQMIGALMIISGILIVNRAAA